MTHLAANLSRVFLGVLSLFAAWFLGGLFGTIIWPQSMLVGGRETLAEKIGCSVGILVASLIMRRYLLRSFWWALVCLAATEAVVLLIILCFTGLTTFTWTDINFNAGWLYTLTWNLVVAFLVGTAFGGVWSRGAENKSLELRKLNGLCLQCGYDLRASKDRCPECGTPIPPGLRKQPVAADVTAHGAP